MSSITVSSLPEELRGSLSQLTRRLVFLAIVRGFGRFMCLLAVLLAAALLTDFVFDWGADFRKGWLGLLGATALAGSWWFVLRPLRRSMSPAELAALVELHFPRLHERLSATIELDDPEIPEAHKGSAVMRELVRREALGALPAIDVSQAAPTERTKRAVQFGLLAVVLLCLPFALSPHNYSLLWARLLQPEGNFANASNLHFLIENPDRVVARGTDVEIAAEPKWRYIGATLPDSVWLNRIDAEGHTDRRRMQFDEDAGRFVGTFPHVHRDFEYFLTAESSRTARHRIQVVDAPEIVTLKIEEEPPAYTGLPAKTYNTASGRLTAFERGRISLALDFNKPISSLEFTWGPTARSIDLRDNALPVPLSAPEITLSSDRSSAHLTLLAEVEGPYALTLTDEFGLRNLQDPPRSIEITRDQPPRVTLRANDRERTKARPSETLRVPLDVVDDIAVDALELHVTLPGDREEVIAADPALLGVSSLHYQFEMELSRFELSEGAEVSWRIRAADERPVPGPNVVWTSPRTVVIDPSADSLARADVEQRQAEWQTQLEELRQQLEANAKLVNQLEDAARQSAENQQPFERDAEIPPLAAQQQELAGRMETLGREFQTHPLFHHLTGPLRQLAREQLGPLGEQLSETPSKPLSEQPDRLRENEQGVRAVADQLRQLEQAFEQLAEIEKDLLDLDRLSEQARDLAEQAVDLDRRQQELSEQLQANPELAQNEDFQEQSRQLQQEFQELADAQRKLADALSELLQKRPELVEAARRKEVRQLQELARQARELAEPQRQFAAQLEAAAAQTAAGQEQSRQDQNQLREDLEKLLADADRKARETGVPPLDRPASTEAEQSLGRGDLQAAAERQAALAEELNRLAEQLRQQSPLSADPKAALEELARREEQLQQRMRQLAEQDPAEQTSPQRAAQAETLAREQEALQRALEQLAVPEELDPQRRQSAESLETATRELMQGAPEAAAEQAGQAARQLRELASSLPDEATEPTDETSRQPPDPGEVARQARELARQAGQLQQRTEQLAHDPGQPDSAEQKDQIRSQQTELRDEVSRLAPEVGRFPRTQALQSLEQAARNLDDNQLGEAAARQGDARDALEEIAERAAALARSEQQPERTPEQIAEQLAELAQRQQTLQQQTQNQANEQAQDSEQQQAAREQLQSLQTRQQELATEAAELALRTARERGAAAEPAQQTLESARQANRASMQLDRGQIDDAARSAEQASSAAQQSSRQLADSDLAAQAENFSQRQAELARELSALAEDTSLNAAAQQRGQQQRETQAGDLANRFDRSAQRILSDPFQLTEESEQARQAGQSSRQAADQMRQAARNQSRQNTGQSAQQAAEAARQLEQAAEKILPQAVSDSPVPDDVGDQVADAFQNLMDAQQSLQQMLEQSRGDNSQPGDSPPNTDSAGDSPAANNSDPSRAEGEQPLAEQALKNLMEQMLREMQQAANSLEQASNQMQPSRDAQADGQPPPGSEQPGEPGEPGGDMSNDSGQLPPGGEMTLEQLELELKNLKLRNWGQLPGTLRTEIMQSQKKNPNADYARHIKLYFEEIAKQQSADRSRRENE
jgi:hypothetical protein